MIEEMSRGETKQAHSFESRSKNPLPTQCMNASWQFSFFRGPPSLPQMLRSLRKDRIHQSSNLTLIPFHLTRRLTAGLSSFFPLSRFLSSEKMTPLACQSLFGAPTSLRWQSCIVLFTSQSAPSRKQPSNPSSPSQSQQGSQIRTEGRESKFARESSANLFKQANEPNRRLHLIAPLFSISFQHLFQIANRSKQAFSLLFEKEK